MDPFRFEFRVFVCEDFRSRGIFNSSITKGNTCQYMDNNRFEITELIVSKGELKVTRNCSLKIIHFDDCDAVRLSLVKKDFFLIL